MVPTLGLWEGDGCMERESLFLVHRTSPLAQTTFMGPLSQPPPIPGLHLVFFDFWWYFISRSHMFALEMEHFFQGSPSVPVPIRTPNCTKRVGNNEKRKRKVSTSSQIKNYWKILSFEKVTFILVSIDALIAWSRLESSILLCSTAKWRIPSVTMQ